MKTKKTSVKRTTSVRSKPISAKKAKKRAIRQARPIHKKVLLHPISVLLLLCIGVFLCLWTYRAIADTITVGAVILAPPLNSGSDILQPSNGYTSSVNQIAINGSCEYKSYTKLYRNGLISGTALCAPDGTFHITADLIEGSNSFQAQAYNITDNIGPVTGVVTVNYVKPTPPPPTSSLTPTTTPAESSSSNKTPGIIASTPPLLLTTDYKYEVTHTGETFDWALDVEGGKPPYHIHVDWGDGATTDFIFPIDPVFHISHVYKKGGYYPIRVRSVDANGDVRIMQIAAIILKPGTSDPFNQTGGTNGTSGKSGSNSNTGSSATGSTKQTNIGPLHLSAALTGAKNWLWLIWPSFIIVFLMVFSFWLGERQEYQELYKRASGRHKRRHAHARH